MRSASWPARWRPWPGLGNVVTTVMTTPAASPSERSERRRREVCVAARTVIVRQGLEATTLRDIAREGGFTTGVVSHYFPDKTAVIVGTLHLRGRGVEHPRPAHRDRRADGASRASSTSSASSIPHRPGAAGRSGGCGRRCGRTPSATPTFADAAGRLGLPPGSGSSATCWCAPARGRADPRPIWTSTPRPRVFARLVDGLGLRSSLSGRWTAARRAAGAPHGDAGRVRDRCWRRCWRTRERPAGRDQPAARSPPTTACSRPTS